MIREINIQKKFTTFYNNHIFPIGDCPNTQNQDNMEFLTPSDDGGIGGL